MHAALLGVGGGGGVGGRAIVPELSLALNHPLIQLQGLFYIATQMFG